MPPWCAGNVRGCCWLQFTPQSHLKVRRSCFWKHWEPKPLLLTEGHKFLWFCSEYHDRETQRDGKKLREQPAWSTVGRNCCAYPNLPPTAPRSVHLTAAELERARSMDKYTWSVALEHSTSAQPSQKPHIQRGHRTAIPLILLFLLPLAGASHCVFHHVCMLPDTNSLDPGTHGALQAWIRLRSNNNLHPVESRSMTEDKTTEQTFTRREPSEFVH